MEVGSLSPSGVDCSPGSYDCRYAYELDVNNDLFPLIEEVSMTCGDYITYQDAKIGIKHCCSGSLGLVQLYGTVTWLYNSGVMQVGVADPAGCW